MEAVQDKDLEDGKDVLAMLAWLLVYCTSARMAPGSANQQSAYGGTLPYSGYASLTHYEPQNLQAAFRGKF